MTATAVSAEVIEFPCEEWLAQRNKDTGELVSLRPMPGTWTLIGGEDRRRFAEKGMNVKCAMACPRCNNVNLLPENFHPPKALGDTLPSPELVCLKCKFACRVVFKDWDKRRLYCITYETKQGDSLAPHKEYLHATDQQEALQFFWAQHGGQLTLSTDMRDAVPKDGTITHVVGVAPAIGFFAASKDERKLVV